MFLMKSLCFMQYILELLHIRISSHGIITLSHNLLSEHPGKYDVLMANVLCELLA